LQQPTLRQALFALPQLYLGVAFGFGIPMTYAAVWWQLPRECWILFAANLFYAFAYDTEYAMVDRDDDAQIGIRTSALTLGRYDVAAVMASYAAMLVLLVAAGVMIRLGWPYYSALPWRRADGLSLLFDPRPLARRLLQGVPAQQLGRRRGVRRDRRHYLIR